MGRCQFVKPSLTHLHSQSMMDKLLKIYCWRLICCLFQHTQVPDIIEHAIDLGARRTDINKHFSTNLAQIGLCYTRPYTRTRRPSLGLNPLPWTVETECWQRGADRVCVWHLSSLWVGCDAFRLRNESIIAWLTKNWQKWVDWHSYFLCTK